MKTALVAGPVFLGILAFGGHVLFGILVASIAAIGVFEYLRMMRPRANPLEETFASGWAIVIVLGFLFPSHAVPSALLAAGVLLYLGAWVLGPGPADDTLPRWGSMVSGWVFVAFFLGHVVWIRRFGISPVLFVLAVVWAGDTAAFYVGTAYGFRRLAPRVSPKKSVEGAVASLVGALAGALAASLFLPLPHSIWGALILGVVLNVVAQMGDLAESLLKRCAQVKDSGTIFPGHGGVLDRVDGFLLPLPLYAALLSVSGA